MIITPPDFLQMAQDLAAKTGKSETAILAVIADKIRAAMHRADSQEIQLELGTQLQKVKAEIGSAMQRDIHADADREVRRFRRRYGLGR